MTPLNAPGLPVSSAFNVKVRRELDSSHRICGVMVCDAVVLWILRVRNALEGGAEEDTGESDEGILREAMRMPVSVEKVVACKVNDFTDFARPRRYVVVGVTIILEYIISELHAHQPEYEKHERSDRPLVLRRPTPLGFASHTIYTS